MEERVTTWRTAFASLICASTVSLACLSDLPHRSITDARRVVLGAESLRFVSEFFPVQFVLLVAFWRAGQDHRPEKICCEA
jgi:hypothetical protein